METSPSPFPRPDSALYVRAAAQIPELARRMVAQLEAELPLYALLPREQLDGEITDIAAHHLRLYHRVLREGRTPTEAELTEPMNSVARRAEERIALADILGALHIGARVGWQGLVETAHPEDVPDLIAAVPSMLGYLQVVTAATASVYSEEQRAIHGEEREARRALVGALMAGEPHDTLAERAGIQLAPAYAVLALRLPVSRQDSATDAGVAVAARRRVRRVQAELDAFTRAPVLTALDGDGGMALLPAPRDGLVAVEAELPGLVARISSALDMPVTVGVARAGSLSALPAAAAEAWEVANLASRIGRPPGTYCLDDVLLEFQLTRPGPARERLAARLDPLVGHPHLLGTLRTYISLEHDRRKASRTLHVHPNTLDYRLRRVADLTGLNPSRPADARVLAAALIARELPNAR
ncbi:MAG: helix-turn-helix domain-containing protein [Actinomycetota bacterium]|nr:helix-turn-helix domain-containing protein [Actinomycetota bacterium]